jgi:hypothetical protein
MSSPEKTFVTFRTYQEPEQADALGKLLTEHHIPFEISQDRDSLDGLYGGNSSQRTYYVKLKSDDFARADDLLLQASESMLDQVDADHYLYQFSDDELVEVLVKPDEWNEFDYRLARKILQGRGKAFTDDALHDWKEKRVKALSVPEDSSMVWIYVGYLFAFLGGLVGLFMGIAVFTAKKTLPNGQRVPAYPANQRFHGVWIMIISGVVIVSMLLWKMMDLGA